MAWLGCIELDRIALDWTYMDRSVLDLIRLALFELARFISDLIGAGFTSLGHIG